MTTSEKCPVAHLCSQVENYGEMSVNDKQALVWQLLTNLWREGNISQFAYCSGMGGKQPNDCVITNCGFQDINNLTLSPQPKK